MKRTPTIHDVAKKAKVSIAAVSLVMNDPLTPRVGATKRKIITDIAVEMGYSANGIAKALIQGETKIIGLLVPMRDPIFFNQFIAQVLSGIQSVLTKRGYHLMIYSHQSETGQITATEIRQSRLTDGLIVLNTRMCTASDQKNTIAELNAARIPFVMLNSYVSTEEKVNFVGFDDYGAGRLAGEFLIARGHQRIAMISGAGHSPMSGQLLKGFKDALRLKKVKFVPELHVFNDYEPAATVAAVQQWMESKEHPTAIFCSDDQFVPDVYRVLRSRKLRIPDDVAVLGRGNLAMAADIAPPLSTITVPGLQMGKQAAEMLQDMLKSKKVGPTERVILPCELVVRASV